MLRVVNCVADCVWLAVPKPTEWQGIGNQINAAMIFAWSDFVNVHAVVASFSQPGEWQKLFSLFFSREEKQLLF